MLRKIRLTFAMICFVLITLLFLDFTGTLHGWFGWLAKIQFLPAVLALNVGVILFLVILTLVCGRIYCSVICPLGVFQDILAWLGRQPKKRRKLPYSYSPALSWLRYGVLGVFIIALIAGIGSLAALLAPYSAYGRIANNLFQPIWQWGNNLLAYLAERADSYAFYETDVWLKSLPTFLLIARIVFGILLMNHGIQKWTNFQELSAVFPDPLGVGSPLSLGLAIFGELACSMAFIIGFLYRLAMIPMVFTMAVAFFVIHGNDPFATKELAFVYLVVFILMYIIGPGKFAVDRWIRKALFQKARK